MSAVTATMVASAALALAFAAPATAVKSQQAKFKVEVFAEQHSDWTEDYTTTDCSGATTRTYGSGGQSFSLTTKKPIKVTAARTRIQGDWFAGIFSGKPENPKLGLPVNVAAIREGSITTEQITPGNGEPCGEGDGGGGGYEPPPPDCGPRNFKAEVRLGLYEPQFYPGDPAPLTSVLTVDGPFGADDSTPLDDLWQNCPGPADHSGKLMETPTGSLPFKKLFGKKEKFKVKAKDSDVTSYDSFHQTTKMNWTVEFKRRGK
jgi:hypothetical protein